MGLGNEGRVDFEKGPDYSLENRIEAKMAEVSRL